MSSLLSPPAKLIYDQLSSSWYRACLVHTETLTMTSILGQTTGTHCMNLESHNRICWHLNLMLVSSVSRHETGKWTTTKQAALFLTRTMFATTTNLPFLYLSHSYAIMVRWYSWRSQNIRICFEWSHSQNRSISALVTTLQYRPYYCLSSRYVMKKFWKQAYNKTNALVRVAAIIIPHPPTQSTIITLPKKKTNPTKQQKEQMTWSFHNHVILVLPMTIAKRFYAHVISQRWMGSKLACSICSSHQRLQPQPSSFTLATPHQKATI